MANIKQLPYQQSKNTQSTNKIAKFILKKIKKILLNKMPYHYLIFAQIDKRLKYIKETSKKYKYFLRFDIEKYYPSINHQILLGILKKILHSRRGKNLLQHQIIPFLQQNQIQKRNLPLGNYLSYILAGIYLLPLDLKIIKTKRPFLRVQDDYLIFCKNKKEPEQILKEIIEPELTKLNLQFNLDKLNSGKFHLNPVEFMGFKYYAGIFTISEKKIEEFRQKIIKITHLSKKKPIKAIIKQLNNKILGFGHYYKFIYSKQDFDKLDAFLRQRLRRYLSRNKDQKNKVSNLFLTNEALKSMGLKSLTEIYGKYASKKHHILKKNKKKQRKNGNDQLINLDLQYPKNIDKSLLLAIFKQLQEITKNLNNLEKKITKLNKNQQELKPT